MQGLLSSYRILGGKNGITGIYIFTTIQNRSNYLVFQCRTGVCSAVVPPGLLAIGNQLLGVQSWGQQWGCDLQHGPTQHRTPAGLRTYPVYHRFQVKFHRIVVAICGYKEIVCAALLLTQNWQISLSEKVEILDICHFAPLCSCQCRLTGPVESIKAERAFSNFFYIKPCIMQLS